MSLCADTGSSRRVERHSTSGAKLLVRCTRSSRGVGHDRDGLCHTERGLWPLHPRPSREADLDMVTASSHRARAVSDPGPAEPGPPVGLEVQWSRVGAACGIVTMFAFTLGSAELSPAVDLVAACLFGPAFLGFSLGLYRVLRAYRETVSLELGLVANVAGGVSLMLMVFAQLGLRRWFDLQFGEGATESSERALRAAYEAGNGIQLGMDVAWDVFFVLGAILLALNMWHHPRFGRILAATGIVIAVAMIVINLAVFPEPPGHDLIDLGPVMGLWYTGVAVRLAMAGHWAADHQLSDA